MDSDHWERIRERRRERWDRMRARRHTGGMHFASGMIFVAIGVIFLLGNMGYLDAREVLSFWPVILIVFGVVRIVESRGEYGQTSGVFWVVVGLFFLLGSFGVLRLAFREAWPILVIAVGLLMLWRATLARRERLHPRDSNISGSGSSAAGDTSSSSSSTFSASAILGGVGRRINSQDFRGGDLTTIFGGCELDLRGASITPPNQAVLHVFTLFGGLEIRVPDDWTVVSELEVILGGFDDHKAQSPKEGTKRLIIRGTVMFGGVEIRN